MNIDVRKVLDGLSQAAGSLGHALGGRTGDAFQIAAVLTDTVSGMLHTRSPDQVLALLRDLNDDPARRASLDAARARVDEILARRRSEGGS